MLGTEAAIITDLWVPGRPKPKGSLKNVARAGRAARLVEEVEGSPEWKRRVRNAVVLHMREEIHGSAWGAITRAVEVEAAFYFSRPLVPMNVDYPCGREGDLDKLIRNIGDALTESGLIKDDRLIVDWVARKRFARTDEQVARGEGLMLTVRLAL